MTKPGVGTLAVTCETVTPTTPVDADGDGIAKTKTSTFDCSSTAGPDGTYTRKGSYTIADLDDTVSGMLGGMRADFNLTNFEYTSTAGDLSKGSHVGYWLFKSDGAGGMTSTSKYSGSTYSKYTNYSDYDDYTFGYDWSWALKPDNTSAPFETGTQTFTGNFTMSGKFTLEEDGERSQQTGSFSVTYKSVDLKYDRNCAKYYKSGSIVVDDYNGQSIEVRYACSTAELYVNKVKSDWWTP